MGSEHVTSAVTSCGFDGPMSARCAIQPKHNGANAGRPQGHRTSAQAHNSLSARLVFIPPVRPYPEFYYILSKIVHKTQRNSEPDTLYGRLQTRRAEPRRSVSPLSYGWAEASDSTTATTDCDTSPHGAPRERRAGRGAPGPSSPWRCRVGGRCHPPRS